ncbi:putative ATP-dependent RNA helicase ucp12, partial [Tilletia horrida]
EHYIEDIIDDLSGWKPSASLLAAGKAAEAQQRKRVQAQQDRQSTPGTSAPLSLQKAAAKYEDDLSPPEVGYKEDHTAGSSASIQTALKGLRHSDRIDFELLGSVVKHVIERAELDEARLARSEANKGGAILIFCPGVGEISESPELIQRST